MINTTNEPIILSCIYIHPNRFNVAHRLLNNSLFTRYNSVPLILCEDFNARSPIWHDRRTNGNGTYLLELLTIHDNIVHNNAVPTCRLDNHHSLAMNICYELWSETGPQLTCHTFDHKGIGFNVSSGNEFILSTITSTWKFNESYADWVMFTESIVTVTSSIRTLIINANNNDDIDLIVDKISDLMLEAAYRSLSTRSNRPHSFSSIDWWNNELEFTSATYSTGDDQESVIQHFLRD